MPNDIPHSLGAVPDGLRATTPKSVARSDGGSERKYAIQSETVVSLRAMR